MTLDNQELLEYSYFIKPTHNTVGWGNKLVTVFYFAPASTTNSLRGTSPDYIDNVN